MAASKPVELDFSVSHDSHQRPPSRGVISDLDGVAYRGTTPIRDSVKAFRFWHSRGIPYAFVTNNSTRSGNQFAEKLSGMGIPASAEQVFNTITAATALLQEKWPSSTAVFAIGEKPLFESIEAAGFQITENDPQVVVLGFDHQLSYAKLRLAVRAALAGAAVIVTNPDVLTPVENGYDPCVGVLSAAVCAAVPTAKPIVVGKPHPFLIEQALAHIGTNRDETIMVGDQIATDIVAGRRAGVRTVLLASDVPFNRSDAAQPDEVISSLLELTGIQARAID